MSREGNLFLGDESEDAPRERGGGYQNRNKPQWRILEVVVKENAAVEVSVLDLQVPRYSYRVGTAHFPQNDRDPIIVSPRLTNFNSRDAVELLSELDEKYTEIREKKIEEIEARKRRAISRTNTAPEVVVRRKGRSDENG